VNANGHGGQKCRCHAKEIDMTTNKKQADVSQGRLLTGAGRHGAPSSQLTARWNDRPRYIVRRTFPVGLHIPVDGAG
jgi:hypothetical protein